MRETKARKRSKARPAGKAEEPLLAPKYSLDVPVDIPNVREQIIRLVGNEALEMPSGNYLALKYLFEMAGLFPAIISAELAPEESLSKILLRNLGIPEESIIQELGPTETKVMKKSCSRADEGRDLAVK